MPFLLGLYPAGEKKEGRANVMDKIEAQTWFSCSIYYSRSEVLSEILGNVKNSEFVRAKQQLHISSCLNTKQLFSQTELGPCSTTDLRNEGPWCWLRTWPQMPLARTSQLRLGWRKTAFPCAGGCISPGAARGTIWCSGSAGASTRLSGSEDTGGQLGSPAWVGLPRASGTCESHDSAQERPAGTLQSCRLRAGVVAAQKGRHPATAPSGQLPFLPKRTQKQGPCFLQPDEWFPPRCYCFLAAISDAW